MEGQFLCCPSPTLKSGVTRPPPPRPPPIDARVCVSKRASIFVWIQVDSSLGIRQSLAIVLPNYLSVATTSNCMPFRSTSYSTCFARARWTIVGRKNANVFIKCPYVSTNIITVVVSVKSALNKSQITL